jgi:hypothetical protein
MNMSGSTDFCVNCPTQECPSPEESCIDLIISLSVVSSLFIVSEILPFLKGQNNGLADCLVKCFEGSDCILTKMIDCLKNNKEEIGEGIEVTTKLTNTQEQQMKNENNININIASEKI